jgi:hypothetical protein
VVTSPRTSIRADGGAVDVDHLQPLNVPRSMRVTCDALGQPLTVLLDGRWVAVVEIVDEWLVEEEWWRASIRRRYVHLLLDDDRLITLFEDLEDSRDDRWYRQRYAVWS